MNISNLSYKQTITFKQQDKSTEFIDNKHVDHSKINVLPVIAGGAGGVLSLIKSFSTNKKFIPTFQLSYFSSNKLNLVINTVGNSLIFAGALLIGQDFFKKYTNKQN